ncbi:ATP-binding cassette domain-containing protein [uncultured Acetatifactor sp.]|jgi:putative ABC transport system ATP-binding protein|uniref:ATP-binding cassette domain-containing protein n=1 Tax=uncultured Acetatifactor sp. TaxID=1671927 RepID=UPI00262A66BE|nr:ATP-binding cassette domain-containing protein [uncultured Acetatifactor sp.]MCI8696786.1 ATP-binding cassette domain-containing protein [Lachnospiraceae bacterium]
MIEAVDISKRYRDHDVLESFHASIETNSLTVITGESGKGKTTLLNILSLLERPDRGTVTIDAISDPSPKQILNLRRHTISYLFQNYGLIDEYTVEKNLRVSLTYRKDPGPSVSEALAQVGLEGYEKRKVYELSGGEQQRVALARILLKDARYIFADEPTGNLDKGNRDVVIKLLRGLADSGKGVILATHDLDLLSYADQHIHL